MKYRFVIVDDHPLFRGALRLALSSSKTNADIVEIGDLESAKTLIRDSTDIDLVLLDLSLQGVGGLAGLISLRALQPSVPIAIIRYRRSRNDPRRSGAWRIRLHSEIGQPGSYQSGCSDGSGRRRVVSPGRR